MYFPLPLPAPLSPTSNCQCLLKTLGYQNSCHSESLGLRKSFALPELAPVTQARRWPEAAGLPKSCLVPPWVGRRGMNILDVLSV